MVNNRAVIQNGMRDNTINTIVPIAPIKMTENKLIIVPLSIKELNKSFILGKM
jgi:hypothetical protein